MQQVTIQNGSTIPFILKAGEYIKITTSSLGAGTVAVPGESIADTLVASTEYAYGKFSTQREVIVCLTSGSADVEIDSGAPPLVQSRFGSANRPDSLSNSAMKFGRRLTLDARAKAVLGGAVIISNGRAMYSRNPKELVPLNPKVADKVYYVDVTNGADANNGTTWALAVKSIWQAVTLGNAAAVPYTVNIASGEYYRFNAFSNGGTEVVPTQSCLFQAVGGPVLCINGDAHTWTLTAGTTYQTTRSNAKRVFDRITYDASGDYYEFVLAASLAACQATPGTWYTDGTTTYVNRLDGAAATATNTMVILIAVNAIRATTSGNMHMYGITQYGGNNGCIKLSNNATGKFYAEDCAFKYSATSTYVDNVTGLDYALCVFNRCIASTSQKDGFNFHAANSVIPTAILFDCLGYGNGTAVGSVSNNGATIHDAGLLIDFNGRYWGNVGGDFAHANTGTLAIGICTNALGGYSDISRGGETPNGVGFLATQGATVQKYDCWGGSDFVSPSGGTVANL